MHGRQQGERPVRDGAGVGTVSGAAGSAGAGGLRTQGRRRRVEWPSCFSSRARRHRAGAAPLTTQPIIVLE